MFKIKLLILLLLSIFIANCAQNKVSSNIKYNLNYIGGGSDGLILTNFLKSSLISYNLFNKTSEYMINAGINHEQIVFVTNVDNTSDREKIISKITLSVLDTKNNCKILDYTETEQQFYVMASSVNYISNNTAIEKIKSTNTEILVNNLMPKLINLGKTCQK